MRRYGMINIAKKSPDRCALWFLFSGGKKKILFSWLLVVFSFFSYAQVYPVAVNQNLIPPYNTKLSSYSTSSDTKLNLQLLLRDINISNRQVRLKLYIEGNGFNVQSAPVVAGAPPIFLSGGAPRFFTNVDLKAYFEQNNLIGITPQQYGRSLPDGVYRICWEVYDFAKNLPISRKTCTPVYLLQNDPPLLNLPRRAENIVEQQPLFINFQWTPRHANATNVSYEFELREIWDNRMNPQAAFLASPNYYSQTTRSTTLLYDISKPTLLAGKRYAWRVKAISTSGISENSVFKNNGYSEIFYFTYSADCQPPLYALSEALSATRVKLMWQGQANHTKYHVQYRKADVENAEWFEVFTYNDQAQLSNLEAGATYDFRVGGTCNQLTDLEPSYTYNNINRFTMPTEQQAVSYNCGVMPDIDISSTKPLSSLAVNETFTAGDFPVTVKQIEGDNGTFSGTGFIVVPYLEDTKIAVEFTGIRINDDYQMFDGVIDTTYDPNWSSVESVDEFVEDVKTIIADVFTNEDNSSGNSTDGRNDNDSDSNREDNISENTNKSDSNDTDKNTSDYNASSTANASNNTNSSNTGTNNSSPDNDSSNTGETEVIIIYENKSYKDGDIIEVDYNKKKSHFAFLLKNYPKDAEFNWQVLKSGTDNTSAFATNETIHDNLGLDMKEIHILDIVANYNDKKIQVTIKRKTKEFKLEEFYALHNEKRLAKSGQTLYLVNPPSVTKDVKKVKYGLKIEPKLNENLMSPNSIQWSFNGENQYFSTAKTNITRSLKESDKVITTTISAGTPDLLEKSIDVKWVDGYNKKADVVSPAVKNALKELSNYVNNLGAVLKKLDNSAKLEFNISFQGEEYLEEDIRSRFYNIIRKGGFGGSIDLVFNGFSYGADLKIITAQLSLKPILSISGNGKMGYVKRNDKNAFTKTGIEMSFVLQADLQVVGEVGLDIGVVTIKAEPYAGISSWGEINYYNRTKSIEGSFGVGKPYVGIKGEILVGGYNVVPSGDVRNTWEEIRLELPFEYKIKE